MENGKSGAGRVNVDASVFPVADKVVAELRYSFDGTEWAAVVTKEDDGAGVPIYRLWYQRGERFQKSGIFPDGFALVDYLRDQARHKFEGYKPALDTLNAIRGRSAASLVPDCYGSSLRFSKCVTCPYEEKCFDRTDVSDRIRWLVSDEPCLSSATSKPDEPEEVFLARLRAKLKSTDWKG